MTRPRPNYARLAQYDTKVLREFEENLMAAIEREARERREAKLAGKKKRGARR